MSINLSDLGGQLLQWLGMMEEQMDTSKLQATVSTLCSKSYDSVETALGVLVDLSDRLRANGFVEDESELQLLIAQKIEDLSKASFSAAAAPKSEKKEEGKVAAAPRQDSQPDARARKIALIKSEQKEVSDDLLAAEAAGDDEEIRALRRKHFANYSADLTALLAKVEGAKNEALPQVAAAASSAKETTHKAPAQEEAKLADVKKTEPQAPAAKKQALAASPSADIPQAKKEIDPELEAEITEREDEIASLQAELTASEKDGGEDFLQSLRARITRNVEALAHLKEALS